MKKIIILILYSCLLVSLNSFAKDNEKCVQIFYDKMPGKNYYSGRITTIMLQNLLGHFPDYQQYIIPINEYEKGRIEKCNANIYLGTYYDNKLPKNFLNDFINTKKNVLWVDYNIWQLPKKATASIWGMQYKNITSKNVKETDKNGQPGFYRYIKYKGEIFKKFGEFEGKKKKTFEAQDEMIKMEPLNKDSDKNVIAWAYHSVSKNKIPYILRNKNHWYIADNPLSYITEKDRYLILCDILFDILNEKPLNGDKRYALVRLEDINPSASPTQILNISRYFYKQRIPFVISLTPIFKDPLGAYEKDPKKRLRLITKEPKFIFALKYAKDHGATIIMHGVSHQYKSVKNPYSGVTADDYEFWDMRTNQPIKEDSVKYVLDRISYGVSLLNEVNLSPAAWMSPHYLASALDYVIFGQIFPWSVGRITYKLVEICNLNPLPENLLLTNSPIDKKYNEQRYSYLKSLRVNPIKKSEIASQFFPYAIYGDYYDERIVPEDLDYIRTSVGEQNPNKRLTDDLINDAKRNKVIRDAWASLFIHKEMFETIKDGGLAKYKGDTEKLDQLFNSIKKLGYKFVDLKTWLKMNRRNKRPTPIELSPFGKGCNKK